jgi:hypothetical protein
MTDVTAVYPGRPAFYLLLRVTGNAPTGYAELYAINPNGTSSTFVLDCLNFSVGISGNTWSGCHNLDFRGGQTQILLWSGSVPLAGGNNPIAANHGGSIFGTAFVSGTHVAGVPGTVPPPPTMYFDASQNPDQITPTSQRIRFSSTGDGGSPITSWGVQCALNEAFTLSPSAIFASSGTSTFVGLPPDTDIWYRARGQNAIGVGGWSTPRMGRTLPLLAPPMTVTPSLDGSAVSIALAAPPQSTPKRYEIEYRPVGGATTAFSTTSTSVDVTDLTPGGNYEWRSRAVVDTYVGDRGGNWSTWNLIAQPNPNTNPGDYFDGSSADTPDIDFVWTGTVNNSTSKAQGKRATGWRTFGQGVGASGVAVGAGSQVRVTGGRSGAFASRVTFWADATAAGYRGGTSVDQPGLVDVAEGGVYWGSIYVQPSRAQRMAADVQFYDAALAPLGAPVVGVAQVVPATAPMTRLSVQATAPDGAEWASVGWRDVAGAGWSLWRGGESVLQDDAMVTIGELIDWFSGDTPGTSQFSYTWLGVANASESQRTTLDADAFDPLADPDCPPIPLPPVAPSISDDCLDEVGTWRRYWAIIPADQVSDWLALVPTIYITTGPLAARQVRIRVYRNPDGLDPSSFAADEWDAEQIVSYIPPLTVLTLDGVAQRVWAEVNGGEALSADRLLYGTGGGPATWPVLSCGTGYLISFDVPLDAPEGNLSVDVALTTRML